MLIEDAKKRQKMLDAFNERIKEINNTLPKLTRSQKRQNNEFQRLNRNLKQEAELTYKSGKAYTKRAAIMSTVARQNNGLVKLGVKTFNEYRDAGGTALEYFAAFFSGSAEQLRIFNFEVASVRRLFYGFAPRGTFSMFNKIATSFNGIGSAIRAMKGETVETVRESRGLKDAFAQFTQYDELFARSRASRKAGQRMIRGSYGSMLSSSFDPDSLQYQMGVAELETSRIQRNRALGGYANIATLGAFSGSPFKSKPFAETPLGKTLATIAGGLKILFSKATVGLLVKGFKMLFVGAAKFFILFFRFTLMASLVMTGIFILFMALKEPLKTAFEFLTTVVGPFLAIIGEGFMTVWDGIQEIYQGFVDGDLFAVIGGVWTIAWGLLQIAFGAIMTIAAGALAFIGGLLWGAITGFIDWVTDWGGGLRKNLGKIVIIAGIIVGLIFGFPAVLALAVVTSIGVLLSKLNPFGRAIGGIVGAGETTLVGERGPELVKLPAGSRVMTNNQSSRVGGSTTINVTINARDTSDNEMRRIADKIGRMINNKINRNVGASSLR